MTNFNLLPCLLDEEDNGRPENSTDQFTVLWLDPGKTTGWACLTMAGKFDSGQFNFEDTGKLVEQLGFWQGPALRVGWEAAILLPGSGQRKGIDKALEVIGMVQWLCLKHGAVMLPSFPSSARSLGGLRKVKALGWYKPNKGHANVAAEHLCAYLLRTKTMPENLLDKILDDLQHEKE
jgi:hypothetical protein